MMNMSGCVLTMSLATLLSTVAVCLTVSVTPPVAAGEGSPPRLGQDAKPRQLVREGSRQYRLECPVVGDRPIMIEWTKDGERIDDFTWERFRMTNEGRVLRIRNVHLSDEGAYTCEAVNGFGRLLVNFKLVVYGRDEPKPSDFERIPSGSNYAAPRWYDQIMMQTQMASPIIKQIGTNVQLKCLVTGNPMPKVFWTKDGVAMTPEQLAIPGWRMDDQQQIIELSELSSVDTGLYTCTAYNEYGALNGTFQLMVTDAPAQAPQFPLPHPLNTTVTQGNHASFQCTVKSSVRPLIKWVKKVDSTRDLAPNATFTAEGMDLMVVEQQNQEHLAQGQDTYVNKLQIDNVQLAHAGWYICVVTSTSGHVLFKKAHLTVVPVYVQESVQPSLPVHFIVGIPLAVLLLVLVVYAIYFLQRSHKKPPPMSKTQTLRPMLSANNHQLNQSHPPPPPQLPPPTLPPAPSTCYKSTPSPHTQLTSGGGGTASNHYFTPSELERIMSQPMEPNDYKRLARLHALLTANAQGAGPAHGGQWDPMSAYPLTYGYTDNEPASHGYHDQDTEPCQSNQGNRMYEPSPQPWAHIRQQQDSYDQTYPDGRLQPYPSLYSCT